MQNPRPKMAATKIELITGIVNSWKGSSLLPT